MPNNLADKYITYHEPKRERIVLSHSKPVIYFDGYTLDFVAPPPSRWQRFKRWLQRLADRWL